MTTINTGQAIRPPGRRWCLYVKIIGKMEVTLFPTDESTLTSYFVCVASLWLSGNKQLYTLTLVKQSVLIQHNKLLFSRSFHLISGLDYQQSHKSEVSL